MPSLAARSPWDFSDALKLLHSPSEEKSSPIDIKVSLLDTPSKRPSRLGDFSRIWQDLGTSPDVLAKYDGNLSSRGNNALLEPIAVKDYAIPNPNHPPAPPLRDDTYASDGGYHQSAKKNVRWKDDTDVAEATDDVPTTPTSEEEPFSSHLTALFRSDDNGKEYQGTKAERKKAKKQRQKERKRLEQERVQTAKARKVFSDIESESEIKKLPRLTPASKASKHNILPSPVTSARASMSIPSIQLADATRASPPAETSDNGNSTNAEKKAILKHAPSDSLPSTPKGPKGSAAATRAIFNGNLLPTSVPQQSKTSAAQDLSRSLQSQFQSTVPAHIPIITTPSKQAPQQPQVYPFSSFEMPQWPPPTPTQAGIAAKFSHSPTRPAAFDAAASENNHISYGAQTAYAPTTYFAQRYSLTPPFRSGFQILEKEDRDLQLFLRLVHDFPEDKKWLTKPVPMADHNASPEGVHVFVDFSNIWIGFMDHLKALQGRMRTRIPHQNISFDSLVLLLERKRPVAKRVLAGSYPLLPAMELAKQIGYETLILEKVYKSREPTERQRRFMALQSRNSFTPLGTQGSTPNGMSSSPTAAGFSSSSSPPKNLQQAFTPTPAPEKWVEQGVDEILHLKILESIVDSEEPSRMVVATGDAAKAEYSEGFMKMIVRALKKGWYVELVAFSKSISREYWKPQFQAEWDEQFRIICLDQWAQFLLDT